MIKSVCIRYTLVMIAMTVITTVFAFLLDRFFEMQWPSGVNIALIFVTAMITGIFCYEKHNETPDKMTMWKLGAYFTLIQFAMAAILMTLLITADPNIAKKVGQLGLITWLSLIFFAFLVILLLNRFGFSFGISQAKKKAEIKKDKG